MGVGAGVSVGWVAGESLGSTSIESISVCVFSGVVLLGLSRWAAELGPDGSLCKGWSCAVPAGGAGCTEEDPPLPRPPRALRGAIWPLQGLTEVRVLLGTSGCRVCRQFCLVRELNGVSLGETDS